MIELIGFGEDGWVGIDRAHRATNSRSAWNSTGHFRSNAASAHGAATLELFVTVARAQDLVPSSEVDVEKDGPDAPRLFPNSSLMSMRNPR